MITRHVADVVLRTSPTFPKCLAELVSFFPELLAFDTTDAETCLRISFKGCVASTTECGDVAECIASPHADM